MTTVAPTDQLKSAVRLARHYRHFDECNCGQYRGHDRAPYCSFDEFRWSMRINDQLIDACLQVTA